MDIESIPLPAQFIKACTARGIKSLYPPQAECVKKGLLEGKNLLISILTAMERRSLPRWLCVRIAAGGKCLYIVLSGLLLLKNMKNFLKGVIRVGIATGDYDRTDAYLGENDIIVATSED